MKKVLFSLFIILTLAAIVFAGEPTFTYNKTVDYGPHDVIGNPRAAVTRANGGIFFCDGYDDYIIQVAAPLTTDGSTNAATNSWGAYQAIDGTTYFFGSGMSYQGICFDGTNYFVSGVNSTSCVLVQLVDNGSSVVGTKLTVTPDGAYSGATAIGTNSIVMADYNTGAIQFFTVSGTTATANGASVANTNNGTFKTTQLQYYNDGTTKWIFAFMVDTGKTRRIDVFQTDGTPAGTTYKGSLCNEITTNFAVEGTNVLKYCGMAIDPVKKVLVASASTDTAANNGFDCFNISTVTFNASATPYAQIRSDQFTNGTGTNRIAAGGAFFSASGSDYLGFLGGNKLVIFDVGTVSSEANWNLY